MAEQHGQEVTLPDGSTIELPVVAHPQNWEHTYSDHRHDGQTPAVPKPTQHPQPPQSPHRTHTPAAPHPNMLQNIESTVTQGAQALWNFAAGDDINTLRDPHASPLSKTVAGASLASNFVPGLGEVKVEGEVLIKGGAEIARSPEGRRVLAVSWQRMRDFLAHHLSPSEHAKGIIHHFTGQGKPIRNIGHPQGRGALIGSLIGTGVGMVVQHYGQPLVDEKLQEITDHIHPTHPTYQAGTQTHQIENGFTSTGPIEFSHDNRLVQHTGTHGARIFDYSQLAAHSVDKDAFSNAVDDAIANHKDLTISYSGGQFLATTQDRSRFTYSDLAGNGHAINENFSSTGPIRFDSGRIVQHSSTLGNIVFDPAMLVNDAANKGVLEQTITKATNNQHDVTISLKGGHFFVHDTGRTQQQQQIQQR